MTARAACYALTVAVAGSYVGCGFLISTAFSTCGAAVPVSLESSIWGAYALFGTAVFGSLAWSWRRR